MKGFETYLKKCIRPEWSEHYINYGLLKDHLRSFYSRRVQLRHAIGPDGSVAVDDFVELSGAEDVDDLMPQRFFQCVDAVKCYDGCGDSLLGEGIDIEKARYTLSTLEREEFSSLIEQHIKSVGVFYRNALLPHIQQRIECQDYEEASQALLETMAFACTNIVTFRQLLIRYDAFCITFEGLPLSAAYLQKIVMDVHDMFELERADEFEKQITIGLQIQEDELETGRRKMSPRGRNILAEQVQKFHALLDITDEKVTKAATGEYKFRLLMIELQRRTPINWRGDHLKEQIRIIGKWNETKDFSHFSLPVKKGESFRDKLKDLEPQNIFPLVVNVLACFLFMMNNYIIAPSSAYYAEALGCNDALSGIMVGAAPLFAMSSSVVYSYWTNYNYKHPMLFAATLQIIGNLLYASAFSYKSIRMCLIGRAVTGLGAPRVINRRCLADVTPFSLRTTASVVFGLATALGAAFGPGISIVIDRIDEFQFKLPLLGDQFFNPMTGPGYFMCVNWIIYAATICFFFKEPKRTGLEELKRRETGQMDADSKKESLLDSVTSSSASKQKIILHDVETKNSLSADSSYCEEDGGSLACDSLEFSASHDEEIDDEPEEKESCCSCFKHLTRPVLICMTLVFFKRVALESIVGASPIVTKNRYGWSIEDVGALQVVNGLIIIPACLVAGYLSTKYEDRLMALCFLSVTLIGMVIMFDLSDLMNYHTSVTYNEYFMLSTGPFSYVTGSLIAFIGVEVCESFTASMMSKVVPSKMAKGTFNAGLLETLVGTGGRAMGDLFVTVMGLISIRNLLNLLILPGMGLVASSIIMILWNYELLGV
ncbi:MFS transporter [Skeletonema marinoi]|uniref:MFS transporter n=1 Tax=Skeletonema marinoi TaxID=267567 RepID=A0AAD9DAJ2_9STRA|nr:MFS transporter [Skeletonema marinoi]